MSLTLQEIFDKVAKHLLTQNAQSIAEGICRYRDPEGRKCAVGCLIPDACYLPSIEGRTITEGQLSYAGPLRRVLERSGIPTDKTTFSLLRSLQGVHDDHAPADWPHRLKIVAEDHGLSFEADDFC